MRSFTILLLLHVLILKCSAQDSTKVPDVFERLQKDMAGYRLDTSAVPEDRVTRKIRELRQLGGGFNISDAISFKLEEDRAKKEKTEAELQFLAYEFRSGKGRRWLDNAVTWIYRNHFTYKELKQLVKFYRTSAGRKLSADIPAITLKSLMAGQLIHDALIKERPAVK